MNLDVNVAIEGDIKEYCIACLHKGETMINLTENIEKKESFTSFFNVELENFKQYPHFLCSSCDAVLTMTNNFWQNVKRNLITIEEYNKKSQSAESKERNFKRELFEDEDSDSPDIKTEDFTEEKMEVDSERTTQHRDNSKVQIVDSTEVERVIKEFKKRYSENKTCVMCGFIAANRRSISSHMAIFHKDVKNNWCLECNKIFENYEEHKESHSSRYQCPFCPKQVTAPHYIEHLKCHSGSFECKECNKTFKSSSWLAKHLRIHTNEKPYICPNCGRGFIQLSSLRYHLNSHGAYSCDVCKKHYRMENELNNHECTPSPGDLVIKEIWINSEKDDDNEAEEETIIIKGADIISSGDLQNFCKDCNKRVRSLKQHIKKHHTFVKKEPAVPKKFKCEFCPDTFNNHYKLKSHLRIHTGLLPYKCKYCDRRALNRSRLKDHERTHTKEKPYICNVCGKALSQSSVLITHMRQHTGRPEICNICGKGFCRKSQLKLHLSKHKGERPYLCTDCGRTFAQRSHLTDHMVSHSDERPFGCRQCEKRFKTKNLLREHMKLHQGFKPFQCPSCPYACYKTYRLQQHMKQHSNGSYEDKRPSEPILDAPSIQNFGSEVPLEISFVNNTVE